MFVIRLITSVCLNQFDSLADMDSDLRSRDKGGFDRARYPAKGGGNKKRERERDKMHSRPKVTRFLFNTHC